MLQPPGLDYDIWREVLKTCSRPDCARLMRTCRFFYTHGFAALLSHNISLETEEDLVRFLRPFQKYADERCKFVRSLDLLFPDLPESIAPQLAHALRRMSNLKTLSVSYTEDIISSHPDLLDAFAGLSSLHKLDLKYAGVRAIQMLLSLRSKLVVVHIGFRRDLDDDSGDDALLGPIPEDNPKVCYPDPAVLLESSRTSLQELSSSSWATDVQTLPDAMLVYPYVYRLSVSVDSPVFPRTMAFIRTYPNLTHFTFSLDGLRQPVTFHPSNLGPWEAWHALNVSEQVTSNHTWAAMRELTGSVPDLYMLGLTCLVESLHVDTVREPLLYMLERILFHTRPRHLTLDDWPEFFSDRAATDVFAVLRGRGSERLITLRINTVLHEEDEDVDVAAVFVRACPISRPLVSDCVVCIGRRACDRPLWAHQSKTCSWRSGWVKSTLGPGRLGNGATTGVWNGRRGAWPLPRRSLTTRGISRSFQRTLSTSEITCAALWRTYLPCARRTSS